MGATPKLAGTEELGLIQQGVKVWNEWRKNKPDFSPNLSGADLRHRDLTGADFRGTDFSNAILEGVKLGPGTLLRDANLSGAYLYQASLRGADLQSVNFSNANLVEAVLRETNLQGADLSTVKGGLFSRQLAGADLTSAKLPEPLTKLYESLSSVKEISDSAQKLFLALLAGCLYSWLTIAQTTDVELITNRATTPLPIIQAAIPIVGFYVVAPLILLCLYFYFHFYLQKLWEELGSLPAVFTDGRELHKRTDPWLLNDLVRSHFVRLKDGRPFLSYFQAWISVVLAWWLVPITSFAFWLRFLRRHDLFVTILHALLLSLSLYSAVRLYHVASETLRGYERTDFTWKGVIGRRSTYFRLSCATLIAAALVLISLRTLATPEINEFTLLGWDQKLMDKLGYSPFANLINADVSTKPTSWIGTRDDELDLVKGADLNGRNLYFAQAHNAFMAMAHLDNSNLRNADLQHVDLRRATLHGADLTGSDLENALLQGANLSSAKLDDAELDDANLAGVDLRGSSMTGASLVGSDLSSADLRKANLQGASFAGLLIGMDSREAIVRGGPICTVMKYANLRGVRGLQPSQIKNGCTDYLLAFFDPDMLKQLGLPPDHNEKLQKQMEAELKQAKIGETKSGKQK